jgi:hypothetical protein
MGQPKQKSNPTVARNSDKTHRILVLNPHHTFAQCLIYPTAPMNRRHRPTPSRSRCSASRFSRWRLQRSSLWRDRTNGALARCLTDGDFRPFWKRLLLLPSKGRLGTMKTLGFAIVVAAASMSGHAMAQTNISPSTSQPANPGMSGGSSGVNVPPSTGMSSGTSGSSIGAPTSSYPGRLRDFNNPSAGYGQYPTAPRVRR